MPTDSDAMLVVATRNGRPAAFEELIGRYEGRIFRLAQNVTQNREDAEEVTQEAFFRAFTHLEGFKGDQVDWRIEQSAKNWATAYDFPAVKDHRVVLEEFPVQNEGRMQAFAFNTRRDKFKDPRARHAFRSAYEAKDGR